MCDFAQAWPLRKREVATCGSSSLATSKPTELWRIGSASVPWLRSCPLWLRSSVPSWHRVRLRCGRLPCTLCHFSRELLSSAGASARHLHGKVCPSFQECTSQQHDTAIVVRVGAHRWLAPLACAPVSSGWMPQRARSILTYRRKQSARGRGSCASTQACQRETSTASVRDVGRATLTRAGPRPDAVCMLLL